MPVIRRFVFGMVVSKMQWLECETSASNSNSILLQQQYCYSAGVDEPRLTSQQTLIMGRNAECWLCFECK